MTAPKHKEIAILDASELIDDADDVILAEIGAGLDLDHLQQDLARIGQPMHVALRNIDRLVFPHRLHRVADGDLGRALDADPVFRAVMMLLQRQFFARQHEQPLDLEPVAVEDRGIATPRTIGRWVILRQLCGLRLLRQHFY